MLIIREMTPSQGRLIYLMTLRRHLILTLREITRVMQELVPVFVLGHRDQEVEAGVENLVIGLGAQDVLDDDVDEAKLTWRE